jgi:hypothetical protein
VREKIFVEEILLDSVRKLLLGRVNEILADAEFAVPLLEFGDYSGDSVTVPVIFLSSCERSEKERIIRLDAYALTISFDLPETSYGELACYAYAAAVEKALGENPALGGVASRAGLTGKKYFPPKKPHCGDGWGLVLALRVITDSR